MIEARRLPQRSGFPISSWGSGPSGTPAPSARDGVGDTAQAIFLSLFHVVFFHTHARAHISVQTHAHSHLTVPGLVCMSSSESPSLCGRAPPRPVHSPCHTFFSFVQILVFLVVE